MGVLRIQIFAAVKVLKRDEIVTLSVILYLLEHLFKIEWGFYQNNENHSNRSHEVSGRKGVDPSQDVATEMSTVNHEDDLNDLKKIVETTLPPVTTVKKSTRIPRPTTQTTEKIVTSSAKSTIRFKFLF